MSRVYKSARGKMIDMDAVKLANEDTIAVGNMKINARGDKLGPGGKVDAGRNEIMDRVYSVNTKTGYSPNDPEVYAERKAMMENSRAEQLHNLANNLVSVVSEEQAVPEAEAQPDAESAPATRGSLAGSVAKTKVVTQELMVDPRKPKGPSRI
jgi:hypothetical protein